MLPPGKVENQKPKNFPNDCPNLLSVDSPMEITFHFAVDRQFLSIRQAVITPWARSGIAQDGGPATFVPGEMRVIHIRQL